MSQERHGSSIIASSMKKKEVFMSNSSTQMNGKDRKWKKLAGSEGRCWRPQEPGESREYVEYLRFVPSNKPNTSGKHYFLCEDGQEEWTFDSKMLHDQLTEDLIGSPVKIEFGAKRTAKNGAIYKHFDVYGPDDGESEAVVDAGRDNALAAPGNGT